MTSASFRARNRCDLLNGLSFVLLESPGLDGCSTASVPVAFTTCAGRDEEDAASGTLKMLFISSLIERQTNLSVFLSS